MNVETGATYKSYDAAIFAGEKPEDIVEVVGTPKQVRRLSKAVARNNNPKRKRRAANKRARASRKANR